MKKNLWIWALAALSMSACTSEDVPTTPEVTENDWVSPDGQVVVQLSADGLPTPTASIGRAAIEGTDIAQLTDLGIFALNRAGGYNANANDEILLNNVRARGKQTTTLDADLHTGTDGAALKRISLYSDAEKHATNNGAVASIYYYPILPKCNYDFYGYYPRQEDSSVTHTDTEFTVQFTDVDGSKDIITGKSDEAPVMKTGTLYAGKDEKSAVLYNTEDLDGFNSKYIRSIKYHNWLMDTEGTSYPKVGSFMKQRFVPNIKFQHRTALLQFYVVANERQAGADEPPYNDREETKKLRVFDLTLEDVNTVAEWAVKENTLTWSVPADKPIQALTPADYAAMVPAVNYADIWEEKTFTMKVNGQNREVTKNTIIPAEEKGEFCYQAGYMLVEPRANYQVTLSILAPQGANNPVPPTQTTTLTIPTEFKAGFKYKVYIQLNALQEVNIHAELEDWQEGSDVDVPVE